MVQKVEENSSKIKAENCPMELAAEKVLFLTMGPVSVEWGRQNTYCGGSRSEDLETVWKLPFQVFLTPEKGPILLLNHVFRFLI